MKALTLTLLNNTALRIDMRAFTPDRLRDLSLRDIQALPLRLGRESFEAGEIFRIEGDDTQQIRINPESAKLDYIGAGMSCGEIIVDGNAGMRCAQSMQGGKLQVSGNCGEFGGAGMSGGALLIDGDCADFIGAALPGEKQGMNGGYIVVGGNAGDRVGDRLRRGIICIKGNAGAYCGSRMTAGTIAVAGQCGEQLGLSMRRGTLLCGEVPVSIPPSFADNGQQALPFMTFLLRELNTLSDAFAKREINGPVHRYLGDRACSGLGEIVILPQG